MIQVFFPRNRKCLSTYKVFNEVKISHYHKTIFEGEKKHGRYIFIFFLETSLFLETPQTPQEVHFSADLS